MREVAFTNGAKFVRADIHIHSYGTNGSYDVTDTSMIPSAIVDKAIDVGLSIISITDHNEILNAKSAIDYSVGKNIFVIPGIEVSTIQGHLLAYFKTFEDLRIFFGKLTISQDRERCDQGIKICLDHIYELGGVGVLAHIELNSGFETVINRFNGVIDDIFCHPALFALEISQKENGNRYTDSDDSADRKRLVNLRRERLTLPNNTILPKLQSSDSHSLDKLGLNAEGEKKLTRLKVEEQAFEAFKIALINYESRIRIENVIPERIPKFVTMTIDGGLLSKQDVAFSNNLTCIIGGRGAGKSTLFESLRVASGNDSNAGSLDSEVWPDEIYLTFEDETGHRTLFKRAKGSRVENIGDPENGIEFVQIESYGQGETAATIQHSESDPTPLLSFLDSFIGNHALSTEDNEICDLLENNRSDLKKNRIELNSESEIYRSIKDLEDKKKRLESEKVGDLVKYQTALIAEQGIRKNITDKLNELAKQYSDVLGNTEDFRYFAEITDASILVGKDEFANVKKIVAEFAIVVSTKSEEIKVSLSSKLKELKIQIDNWKNREKEITEKIDLKKKELEKDGIPFDLAKIKKLATDLDYYKERMRLLIKTKETIKDLERQRSELIERRKLVKRNIFNGRFLFAKQTNENLKNSVDGFLVNAKFLQGCFSADFENALKSSMEWRMAKKANSIASTMSPIDFSEHIRKRNLSPFRAIKNSESRSVFSDDEIQQIIDKISEYRNYEDFESLPFEDRPILNVTKEIINDAGQKVFKTRSISQLSLGQQQSILLAILIQSDSTNPLLIDQPEDNLDSEFIYKTIVKNLRLIKEKRQVIIVTHNANIAVLGDAELVIALKSTSAKSQITARGSIDCSDVRSSCCDILEGGKQAFTSRMQIYGI